MITVKVVHNNCPRGILLSAIVTLISIVSQRFSAVWRGLNKRTDPYEAATAAFVKHKCYSPTSMMYYLNSCINKVQVILFFLQKVISKLKKVMGFTVILFIDLGDIK